MNPSLAGVGARLVPWLAAALVLAIGLAYFTQRAQMRLAEHRMQAAELATTYGYDARRRIEQLLSLTALQTTLLDLDTDRVPANHLLVAILGNSAVPSDARLRVTPAAPLPTEGADGRFAAFGHPQLALDGQRLRVSQTVQRDHGAHGSRLWGTVEASIDLRWLHADLQPKDTTGVAYRVHLIHLGRSGQTTIQLLGAMDVPRPMRNPLTRTMTLSSGDQLAIQIEPPSGWRLDPFYFAELTLVAAAALLLWIFLRLTLRRPELDRRSAN